MGIFRNHLKKYTIYIMLVLMFVSNFCLTGCQDKNQIETLGFVVALGIDLGDNNEIIASIQMLKPNNDPKRETTGGTSEIAVYTSSGSSIYNALYSISNKLNMPLKFSSNKYILVGRKFAEAGIQPVVDLSLRFNDMRPTTPILVTRCRAEELLKIQETGDHVSPNIISSLIKRQKYLCEASITTNLEFQNNMKGETGVNTCGILSADKNQKKTHNNFVLSGSGVFKKDKLVGYMNDRETRGMYWIKGKVKLGDIITENKNRNKISLDIVKSSSNLKPTIKDRSVYITSNIKIDSYIREIYENKVEDMDFNDNPDIIDQLSKKQDDAVAAEVNLAVNAAQNRLAADIFGFGDLLYREFPHEWEDMKDDWNSSFPHINIRVCVSSHIKQTGDLSNAITNEEGR